MASHIPYGVFVTVVFSIFALATLWKRMPARSRRKVAGCMYTFRIMKWLWVLLMWIEPLSIVEGDAVISQFSIMYGFPGVPSPPDVHAHAAQPSAPVSLLTSIGS